VPRCYVPTIEDVIALGEKLTGIGRPKWREIVTVARKPHTIRFKDDGQTPNNPHFPVVIYRSPVKLDGRFDPAAIFEVLFARHQWRRSWRDGIYDFLHFHTKTHEVLGFARGWVKIQLGGRNGQTVSFKAGDVMILPAGTGHRRIAKSPDLLVVGAYPALGRYDEPRPRDVDHFKAVSDIAKVALPTQDPVYGAIGPLKKTWRNRHKK
jgi:uncharacterized protein YjlB